MHLYFSKCQGERPVRIFWLTLKEYGKTGFDFNAMVDEPCSSSDSKDGDIEEALNAAAKIGDDYLQKKAYGKTMPETFNHGTSDQRSRWLKKGLRTGDINQGDTFSPSYSSL